MSAAVVPREHQDWLARLLYALPPAALERLRVAVGTDDVYLVDPEGLDGVPLGRSYAEAAPRIHVPVGLALVPAVAPEVLTELVPDHARGHVFFEPGDAQARLVPLEAFGPVGQVALREVLADVVEVDHADAEDPPLTVVRYERARAFPLWGTGAGSHARENGAGEEG